MKVTTLKKNFGVKFTIFMKKVVQFEIYSRNE